MSTANGIMAVNGDTSKFHYTDLKEGKGFRILTLLPANSLEDEIICTIQTVDLNDYPLFEALSYVWGTEYSSRPVILEGCAIIITSSLESALRHLRRTDESRQLWVDALCIDQSNLDERRVHVTYMKDIYERCTTDLLWLGDEGRMVKEASAAFAEFGTAVIALRDDKDAPKLERRTARELLRIFMLPHAWKRVWIMQEVSYAARVVIVAGHEEMPWSEVDKFIETNSSIEKYGIPDAFHAPRSHETSGRATLNRVLGFPQILSQQREMIKAKETGYLSPLLDVLARFRFTRATDPRDKIYALLGLSSDGLGIQADYARSIRVTYIDCSKRLMEQHRNLDLICQGPWQMFDNCNRRADLPSWTPDFSAPGDSRILFAQRGVYDAGGPATDTSFHVSPEGHLVLNGWSLGTIATVRDQWPPETHPASHSADPPDEWISGQKRNVLYWMPDSLLKKFINDDKAWLARFLTDDENLQNGLDRDKAFENYWRTLTLDCERYPVHRLSPLEISSLASTFGALIDEDRLQKRRSEADAEMFRLLFKVTDKWVFAMSHEGTNCMVPPGTRAGDCIAVIPGGKVPVLLRPSNEVPNTYTFIGSCYVHEHMDGQVYKISDGKVRERQFVVV